MATKEDRRSALVHADFIPMISPKGSIRRITMATNVGSKLVMKNGTSIVLTEHAARAGWLMLKDEVSSDAYEKICAQLKAEQADPYGCPPFDEKLLPKVCKDRKKDSIRNNKSVQKKNQEATLRAELKAEVRAELKDQILAELKAELSPGK